MGTTGIRYAMDFFFFKNSIRIRETTNENVRLMYIHIHQYAKARLHGIIIVSKYVMKVIYIIGIDTAYGVIRYTYKRSQGIRNGGVNNVSDFIKLSTRRFFSIFTAINLSGEFGSAQNERLVAAVVIGMCMNGEEEGGGNTFSSTIVINYNNTRW